MIVAMDIETTGLEAGHHDVIEIAMVPLGWDLKPDQNYQPFQSIVKPLYPDRADPKALKINKIDFVRLQAEAPTRETVTVAMEDWIQKLNTPYGNIEPLAHNWMFERSFMIEFLGFNTFNHLFHYHFRDSMVAAQFINDRAILKGFNKPYQSVSLQRLASQLQIPVSRGHRALEDAVLCAEVYRQLSFDSIL